MITMFSYWWWKMYSIFTETELWWLLIYVAIESEDNIQWHVDSNIESHMYFAEYGCSAWYKLGFFIETLLKQFRSNSQVRSITYMSELLLTIYQAPVLFKFSNSLQAAFQWSSTKELWVSSHQFGVIFNASGCLSI